MTRQSFSLTRPNDEWLTQMVAKEEFTTKTEIVNSLIRQARLDQQYRDLVVARLKKAEAAEFTSDSLDEIRQEARRLLREQDNLSAQDQRPCPSGSD